MQLQTPASTTLPPAYRQRRTSFARLSTIVNSAQVADPTGENEGQITINFPCMPDTIELARRANYDNLVKTPQNPDGQHQYMSTDPLEIPIEFAVNSYAEGSGGRRPQRHSGIAGTVHGADRALPEDGGLFVRPGITARRTCP